MTCAVCGTPLVPEARFCFHCGAPQSAASPVEDAERRVVTVLFGDLSDFTSWAEDLDPERVGVVMDRLLAALALSVTTVGGHVDKLTGDGIMAVFGAPTAHEDDPSRAVLAAAAMQESVARLVSQETGGGRRLGLRVGLNTGEVLAGVQAQVSYTVVGDTVNTASRLSDAAGVGAVFAGRETATETMHLASWRSLPPLRLKGKREAVEAYELIGLRRGGTDRLGSGDETPTIGREAELGALTGRLRAVQERGRPSTVLLIGEAGVGKTRLMQDLDRYAGEHTDARVLWGRCSPFGLDRDLSPLIQMVRTGCGIHDEDGPADIRERVKRTVARLEHPATGGQMPPSLAEQLLALVGASEESEARGDLPRDNATPGRRADRTLVEAVVMLFSAMAVSAPLVLIVDDLHYARDALRDTLVETVAQITGPVLLVGAGRELSGPGDLSRLGGLPDVEVLPIDPLEEQAAERLLRAHLHGAHLSDDAQDTILTRAQGNPFFLAELLHLLVDRGLLRPDAHGWELTGPIPRGLLPAGVQAVLAARIDGLDPPSRAMLRDAAIIGTAFHERALMALNPRLGEDAVRDALASLVGRGMVVPTGGGRYDFTHNLARDVAYAGLPKIDRAHRHAAAARWAMEDEAIPEAIARVIASVQADRAVRLALEMAVPPGDPAWAVAGIGLTAATRLGQDALARDDLRSAEEHLTRALRLADAAAIAGPVPEALLAPVQVGYAEALAGQRRLAEAEEQLAGPLASSAPGIRSAALLVLGDVRRKRADDNGAREAFVQAFVLASEAGLDRVTGGAIRQLGLMDVLNGHFGDAEVRFRQALELAVRVDDPRGAGWALQHLAWSAVTRADYKVVEWALTEASGVFERLGDSDGLAWCAGTQALVWLLQGRHLEARQTVTAILPAAEAMGSQWETAACLTIDAIAAAELGELDLAGERASRAREAFISTGDSWGESLAEVAMGLVARGRGDTRVARTALRRAESIANSGGHRPLELLAVIELGLLHLDRGDTRAAAGAVERADALSAALDLSGQALIALRVLRAQVLRARGNYAEAHVLLAGAADPDERSFLFPRRQVIAHLAGVELQLNDTAAAFTTVQRALATPAEDIRSQIVTQRVLADVLVASGDLDGAAVAAQAALALVDDSGMSGELAATRRLIGRIDSHVRQG